MAHDPKKKAAVLADWAKGDCSYDSLAKKHKVAKTTIIGWVGESKNDQNRPGIEPKVSRYTTALEKFAESAMTMLTVQSELLSNPDYIRNRGTDEIVQHSSFIIGRLERFIQLHSSIEAPQQYEALPGGHSEVLVPEVLDEEG